MIQVWKCPECKIYNILEETLNLNEGNCINRSNKSGYCTFNYSEQDNQDQFDIFENIQEVLFEDFETQIYKWAQNHSGKTNTGDEKETWECDECQTTNYVDYSDITSAKCKNRAC